MNKLSLVCCLILVGCGSTSSQKRITSTIAGTVLGGIAGSIAAEINSADPQASIAVSGLVGGAIGVGVGEYFFNEQEEIDKLRVENENLQKVINKYNSGFDDLKGIDLSIVPSATAKLNLGEDGPIKCSKKSLRLCPGQGGKSLSNCENPPYVLLNKNWALEFRAWYSESGCFGSGETVNIPGLKRYLNQSLLNTYLNLERNKK